MKQFIICLLLIPPSVIAQQRAFTARITVSEATAHFNFQSSKGSYGYGGGASALSPGIEAEIRLAPIRFKREMKLLGIYNTSNKALLVGVSYTEHEFSERGFSLDSDPLYSIFQTRYVHVPVVLKYNLQLLLLDEDLHISYGPWSHEFVLITIASS
jgi:hypothetical protein